MQEELKLRLKTIFEGIDDAERYADAINSVATAEERAARAVRSSARANEKAATSSDKATAAARRQAQAAASTGTGSYSMPGTGGSYGGGTSSKSSSRYTRRGAAMPSGGTSSAKTGGRGGTGAPRTMAGGAIGPHTRLKSAQSALREAERSGASSEVIADHRYRVNLAQRQVNRLSTSPEDQDHERIGNAVLSSRFGAGPFQPLVGRTLQAALSPARAAKLAGMAGRIPGVGGAAATAIGGLASGKAALIVGRLAGPVGLAIAGLKLLADGASDLARQEETRAQASAAMSRKIGDGTAAFGTTTRAGVANAMGDALGVGDTGSAAFAYQQRIGTDPIARSYAARLGVSDMAAPYGSVDPGKQYLKAIKELAKEDNEFYRRLSGRAQRIETEVERYRLLSPGTKKALENIGELTGRVNDRDQMRRGAEFNAAEERLKKAKELFDQSKNKGFQETLTSWYNFQAGLVERAVQVNEEVNSLFNGSYSKAMGRSEDLRRAGIYDRIKGSKLSDEEKSKLMNEVNRQYGVEPGGDDMATKRTVKDIQQMVDQGISGSKTPSGASAATSQDANTKATENLTQTLQYLNKNIGETLRTQQSAAPGSLRGGNLYDAYSMGALRYGTLG